MNSIATSQGRSRGPHSPWTLAVLVLVGVSLFIAFISLGVWQVQRRAWKLDLIERTTQRIQASPVAPPSPEAWPHITAAANEYQAVTLSGHWLQDKTLLSQATTALGAGFWVMTPLQLPDGTQVLVNRGFIPSALRSQWQAPQPATEADARAVTVQGLLRISEPGGGFMRENQPAEQRWHSRDVAAMSAALQLTRAAPYFVDAGFPSLQAATNTEQRPDLSQGTWPRPGLTVVQFTNTHLVYALTWFGMALLVIGAAVFVTRHEQRLRARTTSPPAP